MRLSTSLFCAFFTASALLVACGSEPEEEGSAARPEDDGEGEAGTGGTSSKGGSSAKGGSAGKGGTSAKGGGAGTGGSGGSSGTGGGSSGSGGSASGTGGSAGSASGSGGSAGNATGGSSGSTAGGSAGNATGGSAGASAGSGGNAGTTSGGSAGTAAGGSAGASAGNGGNAGTSSGGNAGMSAGGNAGACAGGAPACTDGYTGNFAFGKAFSLGAIGDTDDAKKVSGKVPGEQIDWYKYDGLDKASAVEKVNPNVIWSAAQNVKVCMYFKCTGGKDWGSACDAGTPATAQNMKGCCSTEGEIEVGDFSCCDGFACSDDATVWVSVEAKSATNACAAYDLEVAYGTGITGAPLPGDGSDPGKAP